MSMFIITQLIGLYIVNFYNSPDNILPYNMEPPPEMEQGISFVSILFAFVIAISLFFLLTKLKAEIVLRVWFFIVTTLAIGLTINVLFLNLNIIYYTSIIAFIVSLPLAYYKIFKRQIIVHNITELLIYPGIAAVFVPILGVLGIIVFLLLISLYDIWAVWHSEFMQKMAKYQINTLKFFTGFFIPYAGRKEKEKIKEIKQKYVNKSEKFIEQKFKQEKIKVNLAILGGGDVIFPIITAGVFLKSFGLLSALLITLSSALALLVLFLMARKSKFYPAMPFLTIGMYIGMIIGWVIGLL
jgi:presenilin-like A22 family membrane protease